MKAQVWTDGYSEITDGALWWTAAKVAGGWLIVDHLGEQVCATEALGQQILAAIAVAASGDQEATA